MRNLLIALKCLGVWILTFALSISISSFLPSCSGDTEYPSPTVSGVLKDAERPSYIPFSDYTGNPIITTEQYVNDKITSGTYIPAFYNVSNLNHFTPGHSKWVKTDSVVTLSGKFSAYVNSYDDVAEFTMSYPEQLDSILNVSGVLSSADNSVYDDGYVVTGYAVGDTSINCKYVTNHTGEGKVSYNITFEIK